jgi:hypothetical protein
VLDRDHEYHALIDADARDACLAELSTHLAADEIEVTRPRPGRYELRDDRLHETAVAGRNFGLFGAVTGAVIGVAAAAVVVGWDPAMWAIFAFGGAAFGTLIGVVTGLQRSEAFDDDPVETFEVDDPDRWWLVSIHSANRAFTGHRLLCHHATMLLEDRQPVSD